MSGFWITGLPRSRTAWWAVVMNALHEPAAMTPNLATWATHLDRGISDSAVGLHIEKIMRDYAPRTLIVERPLGDVLASAERFLGQTGPDVLHVLYRLSAALKFEHPLIRRITWDEMDDPVKLFDAAEWLLPGFGPRALSMKAFNITVTKEHAMAQWARPHSGWHMEA
jgi:hypothetical protein